MQSVGNSTSVSNLQRVVKWELSLILVIPLMGNRLTHSETLHDEGRGIQCPESCVARTFLADLLRLEPRIQTSRGGPWSGRIGHKLLVDGDYRGTGNSSGRTGRTHLQANTPASIAGSLGAFLLLVG